MDKTFHFLSGLPRSGSTLLANILAQNPRFHATQTSGCMDVLFGVRNQWDMLIEHKAHPNEVAKKNVLKAIFNAYYDDVEKPIIFDKCRGWLAYIEMAEEILQRKAKIIVPVRSIPDVISSFEKLTRQSAKLSQPPHESANYKLFQTTAGRAELFMSIDSPLGLAYARLTDAFQRGFSDRLFLVQFEHLTKNPKECLKQVYNFIEEPYFEHDFDHVEQVTWEDDTEHVYKNLHVIRNKVEYRPSDAVSVLGEHVVSKFINYSFWS